MEKSTKSKNCKGMAQAHDGESDWQGRSQKNPRIANAPLDTYEGCVVVSTTSATVRPRGSILPDW